jgi:hypothetical protein
VTVPVSNVGHVPETSGICGNGPVSVDGSVAVLELTASSVDVSVPMLGAPVVGCGAVLEPTSVEVGPDEFSTGGVSIVDGLDAEVSMSELDVDGRVVGPSLRGSVAFAPLELVSSVVVSPSDSALGV